MYGSVARQGRMFHPQGGTFLINPVRAGRDGMATSEPKELDAIAFAQSRHQPLYLLQHANGCIYDVLTDKSQAKGARDALVARTPDGKINIKLFEQIKGCLYLVH